MRRRTPGGALILDLQELERLRAEIKAAGPGGVVRVTKEQMELLRHQPVREHPMRHTWQD